MKRARETTTDLLSSSTQAASEAVTLLLKQARARVAQLSRELATQNAELDNYRTVSLSALAAFTAISAVIVPGDAGTTAGVIAKASALVMVKEAQKLVVERTKAVEDLSQALAEARAAVSHAQAAYAAISAISAPVPPHQAPLPSLAGVAPAPSPPPPSSSPTPCHLTQMSRVTLWGNAGTSFGEWQEVGICNHGRVFARGTKGRCGVNSLQAFLRVPLGLLDSQPVLKVFPGCMGGYGTSGFFCQTATSILHVTKVGEPPMVMFEVAEGVKIVDIHARFHPGSSTGLEAVILTSDNKIYSTGGGKASLLEKADASVEGARDEWADWVDPTSPLIQLNMAPMRLLPPGETLVSLDIDHAFEGENYFGGRITTRSPDGEKGLLFIATGSDKGVRFGTWMFKRD